MVDGFIFRPTVNTNRGNEGDMRIFLLAFVLDVYAFVSKRSNLHCIFS